MTNSIVAVSCSPLLEMGTLRNVARGFGWTVRIAEDLPALAALTASEKPAAILFSCEAFGPTSIRQLALQLPDVCLIPCHGFSKPLDWEQWSAAGAFHSLWLPLRENEVRNSLGFVWAAENRRRMAATSQAQRGLPLFVPARKYGVTRVLSNQIAAAPVPEFAVAF